MTITFAGIRAQNADGQKVVELAMAATGAPADSFGTYAFFPDYAIVVYEKPKGTKIHQVRVNADESTVIEFP